MTSESKAEALVREWILLCGRRPHSEREESALCSAIARELERARDAVRAEEREACAKVAESLVIPDAFSDTTRRALVKAVAAIASEIRGQ